MGKNIKYCGNEIIIYDVNIDVFGKKKGLSYQFLDDNYNSIQPNGAVCCKDFLQDVVFVEELMQKELTIYKYTYSYTGVLATQSKLILALNYGVTDSRLVDMLSNVQNYINTYEEYLGFDKSVFVTDDDKTIAICHFSKQWIQSPVLLSLYLLLIRYCLTYKVGDDIFKYLNYPKMDYGMEADDRFYFVQNKGRLVTFMQDLKDILPTLPKFSDLVSYVNTRNYTTNSVDLNEIVHYSGVMAYTQYLNKLATT